MFSSRTRSFLSRFLPTLLAALLPLAVVFALDWTSPWPTVQVDANRLAAELDRMLQIRMNEAFTFADFPSIRGLAASEPSERSARMTVANNELHALIAADPLVREAFVIDAQGNPMLATGEAWNTRWSGRAFVKQALAGHLDVSPVAHEQNGFSQYFVSPILDNRGDVSGALVLRVSAEELWRTVNAATDASTGRYSVLVDENGVRLADGSNLLFNLTALGPLSAEQQTRTLAEQTYGAQVALVPATRLVRAQELVTTGKLEQLTADDLGVHQVAVRRLTTRPWTVLAIARAPTLEQIAGRYALPALVALLAAAALATWWMR